MNETDKTEGESVAPPTVPIKGVNTPDPTAGSKDPVRDAEREPDDPDKAAEDGLA